MPVHHPDAASARCADSPQPARGPARAAAAAANALPHAHALPAPSLQAGAFCVLLLGRPADEAYAPLAALEPFMPFRDASCGAPCFNLRVIVSGAHSPWGTSGEDGGGQKGEGGTREGRGTGDWEWPGTRRRAPRTGRRARRSPAGPRNAPSPSQRHPCTLPRHNQAQMQPQPDASRFFLRPPPLQDCLRGLQKAAEVGFLDASGGAWRFDVDEYEQYEQVGAWAGQRFQRVLPMSPPAPPRPPLDHHSTTT